MRELEKVAENTPPGDSVRLSYEGSDRFDRDEMLREMRRRDRRHRRHDEMMTDKKLSAIANAGVPSDREKKFQSEIERRSRGIGTDYRWSTPLKGAIGGAAAGGGLGLVSAGPAGGALGAVGGAALGTGLGALGELADVNRRKRLKNRFGDLSDEEVKEKMESARDERKQRFENMLQAQAEI